MLIFINVDAVPSTRYSLQESMFVTSFIFSFETPLLDSETSFLIPLEVFVVFELKKGRIFEKKKKKKMGVQ